MTIGRNKLRLAIVTGMLFLLGPSGCTNLVGRKDLAPPPPPVTTPVPPPPPPQAQEEPAPREDHKVQVGKASWYGSYHQGKETASGEAFDPQALTAAHSTLPLGTTATVTNLETGKSVQVKINDRGPYVKGRKIDLSQAAAQKIGLTKKGVSKVKIAATVPRKGKKRRVHKQTKQARQQVVETPQAQPVSQE